MSEGDESILLDTESVSNTDPWAVNVTTELRKIMRLLEERMSFILSGIALENSSLIHWRKVEEILEIRKPAPQKEEEERPDPGKLPDVRLLMKGKTSVIDLGSMLDSLMDIIEEAEKKRTEAVSSTEPPTILEDDFSERIHVLSLEILSLIQRLFEVRSEEVSFHFLADNVEKLGAVEVFIVLLFLYLNEHIDLEVKEQEEETTDLIVRPTAH